MIVICLVMPTNQELFFGFVFGAAENRQVEAIDLDFFRHFIPHTVAFGKKCHCVFHFHGRSSSSEMIVNCDTDEQLQSVKGRLDETGRRSAETAICQTVPTCNNFPNKLSFI
jgi:hypothetical protein